MKLHRYVDHQRLHIVTKDVISLSISVLLLFRHYISHKITFGAPSSGGVLRSACGAFICSIATLSYVLSKVCLQLSETCLIPLRVILFHASVPNGNFSHSVLLVFCRFIQHTCFKAISLLNSKRNSFLHINSWTVLCPKLPVHGQ